MTVNALLQRFELVTEAPGAIPGLRQLVIDLAVHGRLVAPVADDEPASAILARIEEQQRATTAGRTLRRNGRGRVAGDPPFGLRPSWGWTRLGDTGRVFSGTSVNAAMKLELAEVKDGVPFIATKDVGYDGVLDYDNGLRVPQDAKGFKVARSGAVLICAEGGSAGRKVGLTDRSICFGNKLYANETWEGVDPEYLLTVYRSSMFRQEFRDKVTGIIGGVALGDFLELPIPLPPWHEQRLIVQKVAELLQMCDAFEMSIEEREHLRSRLAAASARRLRHGGAATSEELRADSRFYLEHLEQIATRPDHVPQVRDTVLALAVSGRLVEQDPADDSASELLASGLELPHNFVRRRKIPKRGSIDTSRVAFPELPPSWEYRSVQDLYDLNAIVDYADGNHGSLYPRKSEFSTTGVRFVTARDIVRDRVDWDGCARLKEERARELTKGWARGGDVLLTHNATVGRVAQVEADAEPFLLGTSVTYFRLNGIALEPSFFFYVLKSPVWQGQLEAVMAQTTRNQVSIQKQALFRIPVPPRPEQVRIVETLNRLMQLCDQLGEHLGLQQAVAERLVGASVERTLRSLER